ncbi:MAG: sodium:proton antiporter [Flavobacteriales bacterium CG_4_10_14_0_2_um_filter_32_8]|nr:MAG: sodium:proton antiporter [Flavobacteriales bacterium CG_4_10_14_0_2_um_filter_32_8]PJB15899.1 MAG: sodium:proton antiporter [Flavobacteriales bacterium CG_4_9_14_3_um_filter_32_8]
MDTLILIAFVIGYALITIENKIHINKAAIALLTGSLCWTIYVLFATTYPETIVSQLIEHVGDISQIIFFLIGAMTIVELIDSHQGFDVISKLLTTNNKRILLWIISFITFFLSSVLDNLTTTIVMVTLIRKLLSDKTDRLYFSGMIIIAANAGGAWTPIGDVTTTMLWIGGQISTVNIMLKLFLPSLVSMVIPLSLISVKIKGNFEKNNKQNTESIVPTFEKNIVFFLGISALIFVPIFKTFTHLPPFMGILIGLSILWIVTELLHKNKEEKNKITVSNALRKIDIPSVLFFLGILVAVASLEATGLLTSLATSMSGAISDIKIIAITLGILSAIIDNVPLVAATMGMYDLQTFPIDHYFWELIAYCAGTGGSILIIGSAAGVAAMGIEKIDFFWYFKKISLVALIGYFAGAFLYLLLL